jgi:hypothetical protein
MSAADSQNNQEKWEFIEPNGPPSGELETGFSRGANRLTRGGSDGFLASIGEMNGLATVHSDQA